MLSQRREFLSGLAWWFLDEPHITHNKTCFFR